MAAIQPGYDSDDGAETALKAVVFTADVGPGARCDDAVAEAQGSESAIDEADVPAHMPEPLTVLSPGTLGQYPSVLPEQPSASPSNDLLLVEQPAQVEYVQESVTLTITAAGLRGSSCAAVFDPALHHVLPVSEMARELSQDCETRSDSDSSDFDHGDAVHELRSGRYGKLEGHFFGSKKAGTLTLHTKFAAADHASSGYKTLPRGMWVDCPGVPWQEM